MLRIANLIVSILVVAFLSACASGVQRMDGAVVTGASKPLTNQTVRTVSLWLSDDAKKLVQDNLKFNQDTLKSTIERGMQGQSLIKPDSTQTMEVEITSFRTRSNFSAIMFGFMAGNDNIEGVVTVKDASGVVLKRAKVNASYALGGLAGGQDDARMGWLYEEFAKHAVAELTGVTAK